MVAPGMAAIISLHRRFIDAASTNPNPWLLHVRQIRLVLSEIVPWLDKLAIGRLVAAYDPDRSGVFRFVRISASLCAGARPAMNDLMAIMSKGKSGSGCGSVFSAEIFLLKMIFNFYEECDGLVLSQGQGHGQADQGIRMEDFVEAFSCCCCSVDEQLAIASLVNRVVQHFFDEVLSSCSFITLLFKLN